MSKKIHVRCLPVGEKISNHQSLMLEGLYKGGVHAGFGLKVTFFPILRTYLKYKPDYIHFDWIYGLALHRKKGPAMIKLALFFLQIWVVTKIFKCKVVWTMHNIGSHEHRYPLLESWIQVRFAAYCDWIRVFSYSSEKRAMDVLRVGRRKIRVFLTPSCIDYYPKTLNRKEARTSFGLNNNEKVILCFGSIKQYKNLTGLIESFNRNSDSDWRLIIAGIPIESDYAEKTRALALNNERIITDFRFIPDDEVHRFFLVADVVVFGYKEIENSGPLLIALSFGRPVLGPKIGVFPDRLRQQSKLLYEPGDLDEAFQRLKSVSDDKLEEIGRLNEKESERTKWEDFADFFKKQD